MPNQIPLDPKLPETFDDTPNDQRSKEQLDAWWDHPFGVTLPDGRIEVRCLNGGAWDRATHLGTVANYDQACVLAAEKQAAWLKFREEPSFMKASSKLAVIIMPQRPDQEMKRLVEVDTPEEAAAYLRAHFPDHSPKEEKQGDAAAVAREHVDGPLQATCTGSGGQLSVKRSRVFNYLLRIAGVS